MFGTGSSSTDRGHLRVVLVRPSEPGNVGATARAMTNLGYRDLVLVPGGTPFERLTTGEARRLAAGADAVLDGARPAKDLAAALEGTRFAAATTARDRARLPVQPVRRLPRLLAPCLDAGGCAALVFGPEDHGLSNEELNHCQAVVTVPTAPEHGSLNLAQAVLLCCWELRRAGLAEDPAPASSDAPPAPAEEREAMYRQMRRVLLRIGYLNPEAPHHIEGDLRRLLDRAMPTSRELTLLRGVWSQVEWTADRAELPGAPTEEPDDGPEEA